MLATTVILSALAVMTGGSVHSDLNSVLGNHKEAIVQQVSQLKGSQVNQVKGAIDILSAYNLALHQDRSSLEFTYSSMGASYSSDILIT